MYRQLFGLIIAALISAPVLAQDAETIAPPALQASGDNAVVYFYRSNMVGGAIKFWVFVDETPVGVLRGKQYVGAVVPAGESVVWARSGNLSATRIDLEAGATYYFRIGTRMGAIKARANLEGKEAEEAAADIEGLPFRQLTEEGRAQALEIAAEEFSEAVAEADQTG